MRRLFTVLSITLILLVSPLYAKPPKELRSVQPLWNRTQNMCTTWSINQAKGLWATAAHCVDPEYDFYRDIAGQPVTVVKVDPKLDLALLHADNVSAPALRLGKVPEMGDEITVIGFPMGWAIPVATWGHVSWPLLQKGWAPEWGFDNMILDIRVLPGHSGSPVIDGHGKVISVVQGVVMVGSGGITLGIPYQTMKDFYATAWE
jgi:S1-C subfamily serine protease